VDELERLTLTFRLAQLVLSGALYVAVWRLWQKKVMNWRDILALFVLTTHIVAYQVYAMLSLDFSIIPIYPFMGTWMAFLRLHTTLTLFGYAALKLKRGGVKWTR
jgi:uncharacterized membrane protein